MRWSASAAGNPHDHSWHLGCILRESASNNRADRSEAREQLDAAMKAAPGRRHPLDWLRHAQACEQMALESDGTLALSSRPSASSRPSSHSLLADQACGVCLCAGALRPDAPDAWRNPRELLAAQLASLRLIVENDEMKQVADELGPDWCAHGG